MNAVLIIVAVVAVVVIVVGLVWWRRSAAGRGTGEGEAPAQVTEPREPAKAAAPGEVEARPREGEARVPEAREAEPQVAREEAPAAPEAPEPAKPEPTEAEVRSRVETRLADSERMLKELREVVSEGGEPPVDTGSVGILAEGLKEVRSLAERDKWDQAREKGEALHAQLTLLLQNARREQTS